MVYGREAAESYARSPLFSRQSILGGFMRLGCTGFPELDHVISTANQHFGPSWCRFSRAAVFPIGRLMCLRA